MKPPTFTSARTPLTLALTLITATVFAQGPLPVGKRPAKRPHPQRPQLGQTFVAVPATEVQLGDPLPGLAPEQLADFIIGLEEFENVETPEGGLGPIFNNVSCVACHSSGATGGGSDKMVTRFGLQSDDRFSPLAHLGGSLLQHSAIDPAAEERVPGEANVLTRRQSTPLFGLGLIEAIPDDAILAAARQRKPDGVTGRAASVRNIATGAAAVGRFGWKAQVATLLDFAGDAYLNEMGITSRLFPEENPPNGNTALLEQFDVIADPEDAVDPATGKGDIDHAADFIRYLAAPPRLPATPAIRAGEQMFARVGCAVCHTPVLTTGPNPIAALSNKPVPLYSDLLLHDMGALADGIAQGDASTHEMKTPPLWGLRVSGPYLHDGRAVTVDGAIRAHDGEARTARERYERLSPAQRQQLLSFLESL